MALTVDSRRHCASTLEPVERLHRRLGLAFGRAERREIVLADQALRGSVHAAASSGRGTRQARPASSVKIGAAVDDAIEIMAPSPPRCAR